MQPLTNQALSPSAQKLTRSSERIDRVFADAGKKLSQGMTLFAQLTTNLSLLSDEIASGDLAPTREALSETSGKLRELAVILPQETQHLEEVFDRCASALYALENLRDQMLLVTILARSARIEAASTEASESDFGEFTNEIVDLTARAYQVVEKSVQDHGKLTRLLASAAARQRDFGGRYAETLPALADRLGHSHALLEGQRLKSLDTTRAAAEKSQAIFMAVGTAIMSLQSGDSIRQRLEHVVAALETAAAIERGQGEGADLSARDREQAVNLLHTLQVAHLQRTAETLDDDIQQVDRSLSELIVGIQAITDLGLALNKDDSQLHGSFLERLECELKEAVDVISQCDHVRSDIVQLTADLNKALGLFQTNISTLSNTVADIVVVGLNAGLRAARLGVGGRGLIVIAEDLKFTADLIAVDAAYVITLFDSVQAASQASLHKDPSTDVDVGLLNSAMHHSLARLRTSSTALSHIFKQVSKEGYSFGEIISAIRLMFANMEGVIGATERVASNLQGVMSDRDSLHLDNPDRVRAILGDIASSYTMAAEREIHNAVMEAIFSQDTSDRMISIDT